jgi:predicted dithiol-disulfide oxidoreductase (DUF899 family)
MAATGVIFGSLTLVRSLAEADLIDEYHFLMHPVIVEVGELVFDGIETRTDLNLKSVTTLSEDGVVVAYASVESRRQGEPSMSDPSTPDIVDRVAWQRKIDELRLREKAHTREADAIAAARRRLPMVEVDASTPVVGAHGEVPLIDVFEGRSQLFASYMMWYDGASAAHQCEGCTMNIGHVLELGYLHSRDVTFAVLCQGPFDESNRYREFMEWEMPWYSVPSTSVDALIAGRHFGMRVCYLRDDDRVFETYWTTARGCELMGSSYAMLDMTVYGRQEAWEDSPEGWPQRFFNTTSAQMRTDDDGRAVNRPDGRPISQWSRLAAGRSDDLGTAGVTPADHCH